MMYKLFRPLLFVGDAERAHERMTILGYALAHSWIQRLIARWYHYENPILKTSLWDLAFQNPVGLSAGFDKHALLMDFLPALGFGFVEIGTVTPLPQPGNPRPRLFRLVRDRAIVNRMGFNNEGVEVVGARLRARRTRVPIGINIGKNKATPQEDAVRDYEKCFTALADTADYVVINVSSPNTPNLRELQEKDALRALLERMTDLNRARQKPLPLLLKIAPDLTNEAVGDVALIAQEMKLDGIIATNTTVSRDGLCTPAQHVETIGVGGLSGMPVRARSTEVISLLYRRLGGSIPIIGVGGIFSAEDAYEKIRAGASLVQMWTGLIYEGPGLVKKVNQGLAELLRRDGFKNITEAVGDDHRLT